MREVAGFGLHNDNKQQTPWSGSNFRKYLEMESDRSPASWKINRTSETSEHPGSIEKRQHIEKQRGLKRTSSGIEGQVGTKKQKESMEWTPARQKDGKNQTSVRQRDQTPPRQNMQTPVTQNIQTLNREQ